MRRIILFCTLILFASSVYSAKQAQPYAIASAHPLATQAGEQILIAGGNAFDAAVAISAALAVVEPQGSGLGGGGFWLLHDAKTNRDVVIDGREVAPLAATANMFLDANGQLTRNSIDGPLAAGIPGMVAAIENISQNFGHLSLKQCLQPAINLARDGFKPGAHYLKLIKLRKDAVLASSAATAIFLQEGDVPDKSYLIKQTDLANTLTKIADHGAQVFYRGEIAQQLVQGVQDAGGIWTLADLEQYSVEQRSPIAANFHNIKIVMPPPPTSGGVVITQVLAMLEEYDLNKMEVIDYIHTVVEAMRRSYRDRAVYLGDPAFTDIPMQTLLSKTYAQDKFADFSRQHATKSSDLPLQKVNAGEDTTHFSVVDAHGNYVAATLSINYPFGSGYVAPGTGVLLNDEMDDFSMGLDTPNVWGLVGSQANKIEPGKRMLSSMTPLFARTNKQTLIVGTPGGSRIISMLILALLEFNRGANVNEIVSIRRFHHQFLPDEIQFESQAFNVDELQALGKKGHQLNELARRYGNMQAIIWNTQSNSLSAASDPRGEGLAVVQQQH